MEIPDVTLVNARRLRGYMNYKIEEIKHLPDEQVKKLYNDVGWSLYTRDIDCLQKAIQHSLDVLSIWDKDELIGLIRVVGDGYSIIYVQDILILNAYQRQGLGKRLLETILDKYKNVRQKVLLTDNQEKTQLFYESIGFVKASDMKTVCFVKHDI